MEMVAVPTGEEETREGTRVALEAAEGEGRIEARSHNLHSRYPAHTLKSVLTGHRHRTSRLNPMPLQRTHCRR